MRQQYPVYQKSQCPAGCVEDTRIHQGFEDRKLRNMESYRGFTATHALQTPNMVIHFLMVLTRRGSEKSVVKA